MRSQLKNIDNPSSSNALGRILAVYKENQSVDVETLEMKLDEAILRETPRIDSGVNIIKVFAAIAPLLGLLGTVVGMIGTFQSITLFGTGDPKIMAGDISMALDRKSTRLNSSHVRISYAVFCLKKKKI